jgi:hypothetical protein
MKNTNTRLVLLFKVIVVLAALAVLLLVAGRDLFPFISPWKLLLCSGIGAAMLLAIIFCHAAVAGAAARTESRRAVDASSGERESARWMPLESEPTAPATLAQVGIATSAAQGK